MQFVKDGPDIPERLLQAHEDGRVVFFCGAGIAYPARLPGFKKLVEELYSSLGYSFDSVQSAAMKDKRYDTAVGLLEKKYAGGRQVVRQKIGEILTPDFSASKATETHKALLTLSESRDRRTRLVTTNFDRIFEHVIEDSKPSINRFEAPFLPVPKNRWDGLVYLHGLLPEDTDNANLDNLVVSSGDFGLAYLSERWAARFVSELLRRFVVCFVGYSLDDPVLRYMMDALEADRILGEATPEMFAFGSYSKGKMSAREDDWRAKNVTPILYREHWNHAYLHRTLQAWSQTYRDGVIGKEQIVNMYARTLPNTATSQDDFVGRMLWALSDPSGRPAARFADFNPVPSLDWLDQLSKNQFGHDELIRFGVPPKESVDESLRFSMTQRPAPYDLAPKMAIVNFDRSESRYDDVMFHLARWLSRHLNNSSLLLRLTKDGGKPHSQLLAQIAFQLNRIADLESQGDHDEIYRIRSNAPDAIPNDSMRTLWNLVLAGLVK